MTLILCLDPKGGMLFNNRRQTPDYELVKIIGKSFSDIHISSFSEKYFKDIKCTVSANPFFSAKEGSSVFLESGKAIEYIDMIDKIVIYRWSCVYPADTYFDIDPLEYGFRLSGEVKFSTKSHENIVKEIYKR